jgi:hypothetical protein
VTFEVLHWLRAKGDGTLIEKDNMLGYLSPKRRGGGFEMVILIILNVSSPRFTRNFQGAKKRLQQILFLNQISF